MPEIVHAAVRTYERRVTLAQMRAAEAAAGHWPDKLVRFFASLELIVKTLLSDHFQAIILGYISMTFTIHNSIIQSIVNAKD